MGLRSNYPADESCEMVCIGTGPGPKNVLVRFSGGFKTVVPYAVWKHKLSKQNQRRSMADTQYISTSGIVQKFPNKPVVAQREVSGQNVNEFTIRALQSGKLVRVTLWPEFGQNTVDKIQQGAMVGVDGPFNISESNGNTYYNMTARSLTVVAPEPKTDREVVNQSTDTQAAGSEDDRPF